jgi:LPXTG-motif cell wall-anchored protein
MIAGSTLVLLGVTALLGTAILRRRRRSNSPASPLNS